MPEPELQDFELDLSHYLDILLRRRWIVISVLAIVFISTALGTFTMRPVYQASSLLVIEKERATTPAAYANGAMIENSNDDYYQTQYKLLQSLSLTRKVYDELKLAGEEDFKGPQGFEKFQRAIAISPILRSRLVYVSIYAHDPRLAARVSNALSQAFVNENLSNQLFISKEVLQALQLKQDASGKTLQNYDALPAVVNSLLIQTLKGEYSKLEAQAADMSQRYTPKYPAMIAIHSSMAALRGQIQAETDKIVQSLKTELSGQLKGNNVRIIDPAPIPEKPVRPRKLFNLLMGLFGGMIAGLGIAFLVEALDQSIRTQEDVETKLGLPFLGLIPFSAGKDGPVYGSLLAKELSLSSEALRNLRTMIDFAGVSQKDRVLLLTSAEQGEGKSYVSSNLAVVFSQLGESVLLIDGDLRRPNLHKNFNLSSRKGLSDFLASGQDVAEVEGLLQNADIPNLKVLACGPRPPNPSELLNTPRLEALIAWAKASFDRVIIDCTPMFPINDTLLWGRQVSSGILVVRYGKTRAPMIQRACQKLETGGIKALGVAVNSAQPGGLAYSSYGYYYQHYYHQYSQESEFSKV